MSLRIYLLCSLMGLMSTLSGSAQQLIDIANETIRYAEMFVYGENDGDIGLKFAWKHDNDSWQPVGNGFVFLSEGLKLRDFMTTEGLEVDDIESTWYVKKEFLSDNYTNDINDLDASLFARQDFVMWMNPSDTIENDLFIDVFLKETKLSAGKGFIIPYNIVYENESKDSSQKIDFVAVADTISGNLILRFTNLLPRRLQVMVNNRPYPASPVGWRSIVMAREGEETVKSTVAAIRMDGHLVIPPYSFSLFVFPTKIQKRLIPKDL